MLSGVLMAQLVQPTADVFGMVAPSKMVREPEATPLLIQGLSPSAAAPGQHY